jgi:hypothetical protein
MWLKATRVASALALNLLSAGAADAQAPQPKLDDIRAVKCDFTVSAVGTWEQGKAEAALKSGRLTIQFDGINPDDGTARAIGDYGVSDIIVRLSSSTLHLVQSFRDGPLYATTIFPLETHDGRLAAVHTRHEFTKVSLPGFTSRPEQYYGDCAVGP